MTDSYLLDRYGEKYDVDLDEDDISLDAFIIWGHSGIGRIQCVVDEEANVLVIGNIELFEQPLLPRNGIFSFRPFQRPKRNFRGRGLGSAMLKYVIAQAERLGVAGISGFITPDDARITPYLFDFYRKHGFEVRLKHDPARHAVATIYRDVEVR